MPEVLSVFERLRSANRLPSPPGVVLGVLGLIQADEVSITKVADVIGSDPALTARILKFTNSSLIGLSRQVSSLRHAISIIGLRGIKMLALSFSFLSLEKKPTCPSFDYERFLSESLACGVAARIIAEHTKSSAPEEAFVAGLLSRIGQLVLAFEMPAEYEEVLKTTMSEGIELIAAEQKVIGTTHPEIGARLLVEWQLPEQLWDAVAQFRNIADDNREDQTPKLVHIVHTANLAAEIICEEPNASAVEGVVRAAERLLAIGPEQWENMFRQMTEQWQEYGQVMAIPTSDVKSFGEIEAEAREKMAELTMSMHLEHHQMKERQDELLHKASTDRLTGIANRSAFDERLTRELERARRTGRPLAFFLADIDRFKRFNDTYGHQAGDLVLQTVARVLQKTIRRVDLAARYGGEEFAIIAPECTLEGVQKLAERLTREMEKTAVNWDGKSLHVTISVGAALAQWPSHGTSANGLFAAADQQLYAAKRAGRNCCKVGNLTSQPT